MKRITFLAALVAAGAAIADDPIQTPSAAKSSALTLSWGIDGDVRTLVLGLHTNTTGGIGFYGNMAVDFDNTAADEIKEPQQERWFDWHEEDARNESAVSFNGGINYSPLDWLHGYIGAGLAIVSDSVHYQSTVSNLSYWVTENSEVALNLNAGLLVNVSQRVSVETGFNSAHGAAYFGAGFHF